MRHRGVKVLVVLFVLVDLARTYAQIDRGIPKVWDEEALASLYIPLADAAYSPVHVSSEYYYRIPVRPIHRSYPIYAPGHEPSGYMEWLRQQEPEIVFDSSKLKTELDWTQAGEMVFDAPIAYEGSLGPLSMANVRNPEWYKAAGVPVAKDGSMPFARFVIRKKGIVEVGNGSCGTCHTRVMPDGTIIKGAQGNFPFDRTIAFNIRARAKTTLPEERDVRLEQVLRTRRFLFGTPWILPDPLRRLEQMLIEEIASVHDSIPPGVNARHGTSPFYPVQLPDLIGVKERRYLDHTGLVRQRTIADLMRYAAINQDADSLARYGEFIPLVVLRNVPLDGRDLESGRYSDDQLYALALFIYSLKPPPNPNKHDALAARGEGIFRREGCQTCHTPPLYTNNALTPVDGFKVPAEHRRNLDVIPVSVGTDSHLALMTRRGTGYYVVPSLRGVWYRGPFEHSGSIATLEDWFDPRRTRDDYVPTGFRGYGVKTRPVSGHRFGLQLTPADRRALIAFLKTL